jgi:cytoskeleton protein RodZ
MSAAMATGEDPHRLPIGDVLKSARTRQRIDIRTVEQETKIRIKYLRALENEEWEVLPGPAYAKGFLRTYGQFLGIDSDALVDEYRRTVESGLGGEHPYSFTEPVLEHRRRPGEPPARRLPSAPVVAALGIGAVAVLIVLGLTGGSDDNGAGRQSHGKHQQGGSKSGAGPGAKHHHAAATRPVTLALTTRNALRLCLISGDGRPLIDSQTLVGGTREGPFPAATSYRLDLTSGGAVDLKLDGRRRTVHSRRPASYRITAAGVAPTAFKGPNCP